MTTQKMVTAQTQNIRIQHTHKRDRNKNTEEADRIQIISFAYSGKRVFV